jgi:hypothetical protein
MKCIYILAMNKLKTFFLGKQAPRGGQSPSSLPAPRDIRFSVHSNRDVPDRTLSQVTMSFGHFLAHDIIKTQNVASGECCSASRGFWEKQLCFVHWDSTNRFTKALPCIEFERSAPFCPNSRNLTSASPVNQIVNCIYQKYVVPVPNKYYDNIYREQRTGKPTEFVFGCFGHLRS